MNDLGELDREIDWNIYNCPSIFMGESREVSKVFVLDHMLFTIGTGYEWTTKDGRMVDKLGDEDNPIPDGFELPEDFFEKELYSIKLEIGHEEEVKKEMQGRFFHQKRGWLIFEGTQEEALDLMYKYGPEELKFMYDPSDRILSGRPHFRVGLRNRYNPCNISDSPIVKLMGDFSPHPDYLKAALFMAHKAIEYYMDDEQVKGNYYYYKKHVGDYIKNEDNERYRSNRKWSDGMSAIDFAKMEWGKHRKKELDFLRRFVKKYENLST